MENTLETVFTHITGVIFILLAIATWTLRWLVASWTTRIKSVP